MSWGKLLCFWILRTSALKRVVARAAFLKKQLLSRLLVEMLKLSFSSTSGGWISTRIKGSMSCGPAVAGRSLYPWGWVCPWVVLSTLDSFHLEYGQCLYCLLLITKSYLLVMKIHMRTGMPSSGPICVVLSEPRGHRKAVHGEVLESRVIGGIIS